MPTYMDDSNRGFGLTDGGYYFAISDQMDLKLRADIFTKGSWALNMESNYVKRYKYSGLLQASYQVTKTGDKVCGGLENEAPYRRKRRYGYYPCRDPRPLDPPGIKAG